MYANISTNNIFNTYEALISYLIIFLNYNTVKTKQKQNIQKNHILYLQIPQL